MDLRRTRELYSGALGCRGPASLPTLRFRANQCSDMSGLDQEGIRLAECLGMSPAIASPPIRTGRDSPLGAGGYPLVGVAARGPMTLAVRLRTSKPRMGTRRSRRRSGPTAVRSRRRASRCACPKARSITTSRLVWTGTGYRAVWSNITSDQRSELLERFVDVLVEAIDELRSHTAELKAKGVQ